jgi:hypothetical protein
MSGALDMVASVAASCPVIGGVTPHALRHNR